MKVIKMVFDGIGIRSIERLEKVPNTLILKWIKNFGKIIKEKIIQEANNIPNDIKKEDIKVLEGDKTFLKYFFTYKKFQIYCKIQLVIIKGTYV